MDQFKKLIYPISYMIPLATCLAFGSYCLRAVIKLNGLPRPYNPDPKELGFSFHHKIIGVLMEMSFVSISIWLCASIILVVLGRVPTHRNAKVLLWINLLLIAWTILDPFSLIEWYLD